MAIVRVEIDRSAGPAAKAEGEGAFGPDGAPAPVSTDAACRSRVTASQLWQIWARTELALERVLLALLRLPTV